MTRTPHEPLEEPDPDAGSTPTSGDEPDETPEPAADEGQPVEPPD